MSARCWRFRRTFFVEFLVKHNNTLQKQWLYLFELIHYCLQVSKDLSHEMTEFLLETAYQNSVLNPQDLNKYESFSSNVYGETSYEVMNLLWNHLHTSEEDVFLDLGSGIGQLVMYMATQGNFRLVFGIENSKIPFKYATAMSECFQQLLKSYGFKTSKYELLEGNFQCEEFASIIDQATVIYCNNLCFKPELNNWIKERLLKARSGVRVITTERLSWLDGNTRSRWVFEHVLCITVSEIWYTIKIIKKLFIKGMNLQIIRNCLISSWKARWAGQGSWSMYTFTPWTITSFSMWALSLKSMMTSSTDPIMTW